MLWWIIPLAILLLSALPLTLSVKLLGGKASLFSVLFVNFIAGIVVIIINVLLLPLGGLIAFVLMIWVYKKFFDMSFMAALLAWILQFVIAIILFVLALLLFGAAVIL